METMTVPQHPMASAHLPFFITAPGQTDGMFMFVGGMIIVVLLLAGIFFFWLHSLPERMVHNRIQFDIVAVLGLLSLFTHIDAFWVAALIIALIDFPTRKQLDFVSPLRSIARSLHRGRDPLVGPEPEPMPAETAAAPAPLTPTGPAPTGRSDA